VGSSGEQLNSAFDEGTNKLNARQLLLGSGPKLCYSVMAPEKRLLAWSSKSLCVVNDQPVGNPKRKV
jgi:hypothetical protein